MVDRYYREIESVENDIENAMQISSILLKLKEYNNDLLKIGTNKNNISSNLGKINNNSSDISSNLGKINNIENDLVDFTTHYSIENVYTYNITLKKEFILNASNQEQHLFTYNIEGDFKIDSYLEVNTNILYDYKSYSSIGRLSQIFRFYDEKNILLDEIKFAKTNAGDNLYENLSEKNIFYIKLNHNCSSIDIKVFVGFLHKTSSDITVKIINPLESNYLLVKYYKKIKKLSIENNLSDFESDILSNTNLINTNTSDISDNSSLINTNTSSINTNTSDIASNSGLIDTNTSDIASNSGLINTNTSSISSNLGLINTNTSSISSNKGLIETNTGSISSNLGKINTNTGNISSNLDKITALQTSNIKAFYNLDQIFIYDIPKKDGKMVDKDNHLHIFEKEITYNFIKNSYLEIALKVLTEVSNYVLIGFFQVLCNFYDQDDNLFYTISLSTAMGSINKLSTIKSVFIVPINEKMFKIKIDFFIAPKETQQNRSAIFTIKDINSNKIYIKYYQKTDEMSIKDIQDSLNTVNSISNRVDNLEKSLYLKNLYNILYHDIDLKVSHIFYDKTYTINAKKNDFLEVYFKMLLKYDDISNAKYVDTNFILYDMENGQELYSKSYNNEDYIGITNTEIILNNAFNFNFDIDVTKLKIAITFSWTRSNLDITYKSINSNRLIIKHYGN